MKVIQLTGKYQATDEYSCNRCEKCYYYYYYTILLHKRPLCDLKTLCDENKRIAKDIQNNTLVCCLEGRLDGTKPYIIIYVL